MQRTLAAMVVGIDPRRGMWVISIAAEIGPITPTTIERCNYSATNDKKKKKEEGRGMEEQKVVQRKNGKERGERERRKEEREKNIYR